MYRVRDAEAIGEAGKYQIKEAEELEKAIEKLKKDINEVTTEYDDRAVREIIANFMIEIENYKAVIEKIKNYGLYQESIYNHDAENIAKASKDVARIQNEGLNRNPIGEEVGNEIISQKLNLEKLVGEEENG